MANRVMQQKTLKLKRQKRAHLKQYSNGYIAVGQSANREVMSEYKERAKGLAYSPEFLDYIEAKTRFKNVPPGRVEARDRAMQLAKLQEEFPMLLCFNILDNCYQRAQLFFNSDKTCWKILHEHFKDRYVRTSIGYSSKQHALLMWNQGKCTWVKYGKLEATFKPSPSS